MSNWNRADRILVLVLVLKFKFWGEKVVFKFISRVGCHSSGAENPMSKNTPFIRKPMNFVTIVQVSMLSGSLMHCKTLVLKVITWTTYLIHYWTTYFLLNSTSQELVTSLMFTFADHLDFKGWGGTKLQQFHLTSSVNPLTEPCTLVGFLVRFIVLQDRLFTWENDVLISTECASWEIPWIAK